jgi:murein DD-endopeptidase MepM/ murein hydrolase activator NlpD
LRRETYTVAVMPSSGRHVRTFSVSVGSLILALVFIAILFASFLTFGSLAIQKYCKKQELVATEAIQKYEAAVQKYEALQNELQEIRERYSDFMGILGIEMVEVGDELGKGGPEMPELTDDSIAELSSASETADGTIADSSSVLMEALSLKSDFEKLTGLADARIAELATTPSIWPIKGPGLWISSRFGTRRNPFTNAWERHEGIDIPSPRGTPVIATADGTITKMSKDRYLGNFIEIRHSETFSTLYGHMDRFAKDMKKGTKVKRSQVIGYVGKTGKATGCHVHYEVRVRGKRVNPTGYILD